MFGHESTLRPERSWRDDQWCADRRRREANARSLYELAPMMAMRYFIILRSSIHAPKRATMGRSHGDSQFKGA
jgi:hypothetical protein